MKNNFCPVKLCSEYKERLPTLPMCVGSLPYYELQPWILSIGLYFLQHVENCQLAGCLHYAEC